MSAFSLDLRCDLLRQKPRTLARLEGTLSSEYFGLLGSQSS
jgi:hypothetical protein